MFDIFISHSSKQKDLARFTHYLAMMNNFSSWFDEDKLNYGDKLEAAIEKGILNSKTFILFHSKEAMDNKWVPLEMKVAQQKFQNTPPHLFKIVVIKLDKEPLEDWWAEFLYLDWDSKHFPSSVMRLLEIISSKKILSEFSFAAFLGPDVSKFFQNSSGSPAEHDRNYILYYMSHIKALLSAILHQGRDHPHNQKNHQDTIEKILNLNLFQKLPKVNDGWLPVSPGEFEVIHSTRMYKTPIIHVLELPERYGYKFTHNDEVSTRILFFERSTNEPVHHAVPFSVTFDSLLGV